jgi:hypothetical protein
MSLWFISPWEAARFSLEAQRQIALLFFPFASRQEQRRLEMASDDNSRVVTQQDIGSPADVAIPPRSRKTAQPRTVAARNAAEVIRKATGTRKLKSSKRPRKNDKRRS